MSKVHECYFCLYINSERTHTTLLKDIIITQATHEEQMWMARGLLKEEFA